MASETETPLAVRWKMQSCAPGTRAAQRPCGLWQGMCRQPDAVLGWEFVQLRWGTWELTAFPGPPWKLEESCGGWVCPGQSYQRQVGSKAYMVAVKMVWRSLLSRDGGSLTPHGECPRDLCGCWEGTLHGPGRCQTVTLQGTMCVWHLLTDSSWPHELCSQPGSSVHGILQARTLELPFPSPGIKATSPVSPALQTDSLPPHHHGSLL